MIYDKLKKNKNNIIDIKNRVVTHFVRGPFVEILGSINEEYKVQFIDKKINTIRFETTIRNNNWAKSNIEYCIDWKVRVLKGDDVFYEHDFNPNGKRVFISMGFTCIG